MDKNKIEVTLHKLGSKPQVVEVKSLGEARRKVIEFVNKTNIPSSMMGVYFGNVKVNGVKKFEISYNGRVWTLNGDEVRFL